MLASLFHFNQRYKKMKRTKRRKQLNFSYYKTSKSSFLTLQEALAGCKSRKDTGQWLQDKYYIAAFKAAGIC